MTLMILARQLTRLPMGNQAAALKTTREASLTSTELAGVIDLVLASSTREQTEFVLADPRRALRQSALSRAPLWRPERAIPGWRDRGDDVSLPLPARSVCTVWRKPVEGTT
jgi:hypothetical protein